MGDVDAGLDEGDLLDGVEGFLDGLGAEGLEDLGGLVLVGVAHVGDGEAFDEVEDEGVGVEGFSRKGCGVGRLGLR
ncbi:MAG: hypothetical protein KF745_05465 [Phycisphaeraceae bacterium]|nr:hypothetical protein [Phycisphaeraceae bacterium]